MSVIKVVAVRDRKLGAFLRPFTVPSLGVAIRGFQDELNRPDGEMHKHPDDYDLYHLADFNEDTGEFIQSQDSPTQIAGGGQLSTRVA